MVTNKSSKPDLGEEGMKTHRNTIELNGRLYDAHTGVAVHEASNTPKAKAKAPPASASHVAPAKKTVSKPTSMRYVDGIRKNPAAPAKHREKPIPAQKVDPTHINVVRSSPTSVSTRPQRSVTLHRSGVKVPSLTAASGTKPATKTQTSTTTIVSKIDQNRLERAQNVNKSTLIKKFNTPDAAPKAHKSHEPKQSTILPATPEKAQAESTMQDTKHQLIAHAQQQMEHAQRKPATKAIKSRRISPFAKYGAPALVVLLLAGYVAYLNVPSLSLKVASSKAGFTATLPGNGPAGYSLRSPVSYSPGQVTIDFASNTDSRSFSLTQQPTTWDSQALLENYVTKENKDYLTYQDRGLTIYIFNGSDAAWVSGGKFYSVKGADSQLNTEQLRKLATSM